MPSPDAPSPWRPVGGLIGIGKDRWEKNRQVCRLTIIVHCLVHRVAVGEDSDQLRGEHNILKGRRDVSVRVRGSIKRKSQQSNGVILLEVVGREAGEDLVGGIVPDHHVALVGARGLHSGLQRRRRSGELVCADDRILENVFDAWILVVVVSIGKCDIGGSRGEINLLAVGVHQSHNRAIHDRKQGHGEAGARVYVDGLRPRVATAFILRHVDVVAGRTCVEGGIDGRRKLVLCKLRGRPGELLCGVVAGHQLFLAESRRAQECQNAGRKQHRSSGVAEAAAAEHPTRREHHQTTRTKPWARVRSDQSRR
eukprot:m.85878 g.85878  ORF g.85878 m.85878 type:complete len:310 (-) comp50892_c0_seq2:264-1193(-)